MSTRSSGRGHAARRTSNNRKERLQRADLGEPDRFDPWPELDTDSPAETETETDDAASS